MQIPVSDFCVQPLQDPRTLRNSTELLPVGDLSRAARYFAYGDHVRIVKGIYSGRLGTIMTRNWDGGYLVYDRLINPDYLAEWQQTNGYWIVDYTKSQELVPASPLSYLWKPREPERVIVVLAEQLEFADPSKRLDARIGRDFLVNKRVVVTGAHELKGLHGFVVSVDPPRQIAQVSLDAKTVSANKLFDIALDNLVLDVSNSR